MKVAVIGSGPAGYYTLEGLLERFPEGLELDIIDRLPTPYGLIRAGVAPDHQSIKNVARRFEQTQGQGNIAFFGNIHIGDAISISTLQALYDVVVLATGAPLDRALGIPGDGLPGVLGSAAFVGWYNSHPDFAQLNPPLQTQCAVVIGNGNVALDIARVLVKTPLEMQSSDLATHAAHAIHASPIAQVHILGRRGPHQVHFTPKELGEFAALAQAEVTADPADFPAQDSDAWLDPGQRKVVGHLRRFAQTGKALQTGLRRSIHFGFCWRPVAILGETCVQGVRLERMVLEGDQAVGTGEMRELSCGLVITAIGYRSQPIPGVPYDNQAGRFANVDGLIRPGLYCVGWARRGPTGTIGTNRPDGFAIAERIKAQVDACPTKAGRAGLRQLINDQDLWAVDFASWKRIEAAETAAATPPAPRAKIAQLQTLLNIASGKENAN
jgi:NADPH-dependent glutamate synthase beta subunit-like oxidoreductase